MHLCLGSCSFIWLEHLSHLSLETWLRMFIHLQDSPWGSPPGNYPDGLGWTECPSSGPHHTWAYPVIALRFRIAVYQAPRLFAGAKPNLLHPVLPLSLSRWYLPKPTHPHHILPTNPYHASALVTPAWIPPWIPPAWMNSSLHLSPPDHIFLRMSLQPVSACERKNCKTVPKIPGPWCTDTFSQTFNQTLI